LKTLIFGAEPLGSLYASLLHRAGNDVTIIAGNEHFTFLRENGIVLINILKQVFNSKFAEIAMMMHANAARDEMMELGNEFKTLKNQTSIKTPNLDELISCIEL